MDELRYVSANFISAKNNVDINMPVMIKAVIKVENTADDGSANSSNWPTYISNVSTHACMFDEAILALFRSDAEESAFSASED